MKKHMKPLLPSRTWRILTPLVIVTLFSCLLGVAVYELFVIDSQTNLRTIRLAYQTERQQFWDLQENRKLQETVTELNKDLETVWGLIPAQKDFASIAVAISELARMEQVTIPGMSYSHNRSAKDLPSKASLTFSATGRYASIYRFIHLLEQSEQYLIIERLDASQTQSTNKSQESRVQFNVKVSTFLKKDPLDGNTS